MFYVPDVSLVCLPNRCRYMQTLHNQLTGSRLSGGSWRMLILFKTWLGCSNTPSSQYESSCVRPHHQQRLFHDIPTMTIPNCFRWKFFSAFRTGPLPRPLSRHRLPRLLRPSECLECSCCIPCSAHHSTIIHTFVECARIDSWSKVYLQWVG